MSAPDLTPFDFSGGLTPDSLRSFFVWAARNNVSDIHLQGDNHFIVGRYGRLLRASAFAVADDTLAKLMDEVFSPELRPKVRGGVSVDRAMQLDGDPILYAEGYATARSLFMLTGRPVVMTIDAGNMVAVAGVLKARYPDSPHLFMADVDHAKEKNKGVLSANRAAAATAGAVLLPDLTAAEIERGFTDFNDLHQFRGAERLRTTLLPDIAQALEQLNHKDSPMATPDDAQPAPDNIPATSPDAAEATPARRPGAAKEKTDEILKLRDEGLKPSQIAEQLGIGQTSVYRILKAQQPEAAPATPSAPAAADVTASGVKDSPAASAVVQNMPEPEPSQRDSAVTVDATPAPELVVTAPVPEPRAASDKDASGVAPLSEPAAPEAPPVPETPAANPSVAAASESAPSDPYQNFTGLYGAGAELRDRLAALASGQISPAALLDDDDKFTRGDVRINRFLEVAPPSESRLLATMPMRQRRSYVRGDRVQGILRVLDETEGAQDTAKLVLTDPALAAVCEFDLECTFSWKRSPSAAVRSAILWRMVLESLPVRGRGYKVRLREPRLMGATRKAIEDAAQNFVSLAPERTQ